MNVWYESKSFLAGPVGSEPRTMPMGDAQIVVDSCGSNKGRGPEAAALGKRRKALPKLVATQYVPMQDNSWTSIHKTAATI